MNKVVIDILYENLKKRQDHKDLSLFHGLSGDLLLLKDLYNLTGQIRFKDLLLSNASIIIDNIDEINNIGLSNGICGILYSLMSIKDVEECSIDLSGELDELIWSSVIQAYHKGNYDLQSGLIGYGLYYLNTSDSDSYKKEKVISVCQLICNLMIKTESITLLPYHLEKHPYFSSRSIWTNNCFLHGINSVIAFFLICIKEHICNELIINTVISLLEQEYSFFIIEDQSYPIAYGFDENGLHIDKRPTKLYYCTGDYGIIANFLNAYELFNENKYYEYARKSYKRVANRFESGEQNKHLCFCHGLATHVYFANRFRDLTEICFNTRIDHFSSIITRALKENHNTSILEGANGIIMTLLSQYKQCSLERILLLR